MTSNTNLDIVSMSVRIYRIHKDLIDKAAALEPGRTPSDYIREVMSTQAALDLNVDLPHVPDVNRGRAGGIVNQAAAKLGMTRDEFEAIAVRHMAAQTLESNALVTPALGMPSVRPGSYSETPASERPTSRQTRAHSESRQVAAPVHGQRKAR